MRFSKEEIEEIKRLRIKGVLVRDIAKQFKCDRQSIYYHTNEKTKERMKKNAREWYKKRGNDKEFKNKRKKYIREYQRRRYHHDEEYRERIKRYMKRYMNRKYKKKDYQKIRKKKDKLKIIERRKNKNGNIQNNDWRNYPFIDE